MIGQDVSHYRIEAVLGEGAAGTVYRASDLNLPGHEVAIKALKPSAEGDRQAHERFLREARALVQIHIRQLVQTEHTAAIVFWFSMTASGLSLLTLPFGWVVPDAKTTALLVMAGFVGAVAQILVTSSYRFAPASMLAPFDYASMLFAIVIGWVWFSELPTAIMLTGALLVIAGNILVIWRERQLGLERARARSVSDPKA